MLRTVELVERAVRDVPQAAIVVPAGASTIVIKDSIYDPENREFAYIELFNAGAGDAYYRFGGDADNVTNFNGIVKPNGMLEVKTRQAVRVYSPTGCTCAVTMLERQTAITNDK